MPQMRIRRSEFYFLFHDEFPFLDLKELFQGKAAIGSLRQTYALSIVAGSAFPLSREHLEVLAFASSSQYLDTEILARMAKVDNARVADLVSFGLLLEECIPYEKNSFGWREQKLRDTGWSKLAALYHFMSKWDHVDVGLRLPRTDEELSMQEGDKLAFFDEWCERHGPPPSQVVEREDAQELVDLPLIPQSSDFYSLLKARKTTRHLTRVDPLSVRDLSIILYYVFGWHGYLPLPQGAMGVKKTSPSGGDLHPIECYVLATSVEGLESGLYHYRGDRHALEFLCPMTEETAAKVSVSFAAGQEYVSNASALFLMTARFHRSYWKYRDNPRSYAVIMMEAGHLSQTFYLVCASLGLGAFVTAAVNGSEIERLVEIDGIQEGAIAICGCGRSSDRNFGLDPTFLPFVPRTTPS